jgi:hypothetical protein
MAPAKHEAAKPLRECVVIDQKLQHRTPKDGYPSSVLWGFYRELCLEPFRPFKFRPSVSSQMLG